MKKEEKESITNLTLPPPHLLSLLEGDLFHLAGAAVQAAASFRLVVAHALGARADIDLLVRCRRGDRERE